MQVRLTRARRFVYCISFQRGAIGCGINQLCRPYDMVVPLSSDESVKCGSNRSE